MVPLGDGSIIGTTVLQPHHSQAPKGILKRTPADPATQNNGGWDYELSPPPVSRNAELHGKTTALGAPDNSILHLPMGLPPPPPGAAISGTPPACFACKYTVHEYMEINSK